MDLANGVLDLFDKALDDEPNFYYLNNDISYFGFDCLKIAVVGDRQRFVASSCVQNFLTKLWHGEISTKKNTSTSIKVEK